MSANTKIEWADHTFNPWIGCTKVGPGCDHCYAKAEWEDRRHRVVWGAGHARSRTKTWGDPVKWNANHEAFFAEHGRRQRVFCSSLADVFDNQVPEAWRWDLFRLIKQTPHLDWLLLTKRIGNARIMLNSAASTVMDDFVGADTWDKEPWPNVWIGATVVTQEEADRDIPKLLAVPATKRFLSMEPLLGSVDLTALHNPGPLHQRGAFINALRGGTYGQVPTTGERMRITHGPIECIDWVIVGGESGPGARPMHPDWARSLRDQCEAAGVPFMFKQWGEFAPNWLNDDAGQKISGSEWIDRMGKKIAGRTLDGRTWDEVPVRVVTGVEVEDDPA